MENLKLILGEASFNSIKYSFKIYYSVLSTQDIKPTFLFVPMKAKYYNNDAEIKAWFDFGKWWLKCTVWDIDKEDVRKYCEEKLSRYIK